MKFTLTCSSPRARTLAFLSALAVASSAFGGTIPGNLGSGLDVLLRDRLEQQTAKGGSVVDPGLAEYAQSYRDISFTNPDGQVKVYIHLAPRSATKVAKGATANFDPKSILPASAQATAIDMGYRAGVIEAWVSLDDVAALAQDKRVLSVILAIKPIQDVGATTAQGFVQHRANLTSRNGAGVTVGVMSDSYDTNPSASTRAAVDVTTGDLPGTTNPNGNTQPVVIVDDPLTGTDEGRGMAQIVHDMAPGARLGVATASAGQVSFADNIRSLAGLPSGSHTVPGFAANVIVDDLFYSDSPMFGTSLVGRAVNEVAALGVTYFSSAGNRSAQQGYFSDSRIVTPAAGQAANPTLNFSTVPASLYAGGFQNFRTDGGTDIAQTIVGGGSISFQWDDPYDVVPPSFNPTPFFQSSGTATSTTVSTDFTLPGLVATQQYRVTVIANPPPPANPFDAVVEIYDPNNTLILRQDTGTDEEIFFFASISGSYRVAVTAFTAATGGSFDIKAFNASGTQRVTTDYNLLFFNNTTGAFISAIASNNLAANRPLELAALPAGTIQMVIARANTPTAPVPATKVRYVMTAGRALEYFDFQTPITFGHNHEPGALSAAGVGPFPPFLPEDYSSPGPSYIYFDQDANRLATPIIRQKPDVAACTNVNTTFFGGDSTRDADAFPNFAGTSAAAPSAAGIAALVLQANGGPGSVTQPQMRTILQRSGFGHDLDPFFASGQARTTNGGKLTITVRANQNGFSQSDATNVSTTDPNVIAVSYVGPGSVSVSSLSFDMRGGNTAGGNEVTMMQTPGLVFDTRAPTAGFPFTLGRTTGTLTPAAITAAFIDQAPPPSLVGQFFTLNLTFTAGSFTGGSAFTFGVDRDEFSGANNPPASTFGNSADHWGRNHRYPSGELANSNDPSGQPALGVRFSGTLSDGSTFSGVMANRNGKGYSFLDGYGFINAQDAVAQPLP